MFAFIKNSLASRDIRRRLLFTLFIFAVFRLGVYIPVPGVNAAALQDLNNTGILSLLNTFGGGALQQYSIFSLGVSPYITSSILVQLLQMDVLPKFTEWAKQGEVGRRKLNQATIYIAIIIALVQGAGLSFGFNQLSGFGLILNNSVFSYITIALVMTAGTMLLVWLGEQITRNGIGNGVSMLIFAGIVAEVPKDFYGFFQNYLGNEEARNQYGWIVGLVVLILLISIVVVVLMERAQRRIPIHHSKKVSGAKSTAHLPLKINSAGVIPVIFATSFMTLPTTIFSLMGTQDPGPIQQFFIDLFNLQSPMGIAFYTVLLVAFTYFYALIQVNPEKVAENLQKQSAYIPSVRPGKDTEDHITKILNRLSFVGALYLTIIAISPMIANFFAPIPMNLALSGTSILIVVGVGIETAKQIEGRITQRSYSGFLYLD
ncbi:preprotein translocase subunit SecY [Aerococcaceae bacterium DSM 111176]|nr:preprotein translocase subunit SecY [Aerococcaceae bacterium DSM 111176]